MKGLKLVTLIVFLLISIIAGNAKNMEGDFLTTRYKINEEWYLQAQGGINYMAAENTRFVSLWEVISPQVALSIGKHITPVWSARLQLIGGQDKGVYYAHDKNSPKYSFSHYGVLGIGAFNITDFVNRNKKSFNQKSWNISALLGLGAVYTSFGFTKGIAGASFLNCNNGTYLSVFAGVEAARKVSQNWEVNVELSSNWMGNGYNGQTSIGNSKLNLDGMINLLVGVRYTFNRVQRKKQVSVVTYSEKPLIPPSQRYEKEIEQKMVDESKSALRKQEKSYYSIEELLETMENNESIRGKQLAKTENVRFDFGKCVIKPFNSIYLDKVAELMKKANVVLLIRGFAVGNESVLDDQLTDQRVKAVRDYLLKHGIERDRLVYQCLKGSEISLSDKDKGQIVELEIVSL